MRDRLNRNYASRENKGDFFSGPEGKIPWWMLTVWAGSLLLSTSLILTIIYGIIVFVNK